MRDSLFYQTHGNTVCTFHSGPQSRGYNLHRVLLPLPLGSSSVGGLSIGYCTLPAGRFWTWQFEITHMTVYSCDIFALASLKLRKHHHSSHKEGPNYDIIGFGHIWPQKNKTWISGVQIHQLQNMVPLGFIRMIRNGGTGNWGSSTENCCIPTWNTGVQN